MADFVRLKIKTKIKTKIKIVVDLNETGNDYGAPGKYSG